ncbi:MAG TPA: porin family protein [Duganella sp.]|uniref:porin family protein n=1 Tax=Duganella sp. TaxID=1904440 RepID=UPI002ECFF5E9
MRLLIIAAALAVAGPSFAAPFEPGVYIGATAGRASVSSKYADNSSDISLGASLGYQYTPNFGFDVYTRSLSFDPFRGLFTEAGYYPERTYGIAVQGSVPLNELFSLYGRAGVGRTSMQATRSDLPDRDETDPMVGVGVSYAFNRHWSIGADFSYLTKTEVSLYSFSARFNF